MTPLTLDRSIFLDLVEQDRPLSEIRDLLGMWLQAGATRDEIRVALNEIRAQLQAAGQDTQEDRVLDALDIVEGWVSPHLKLVEAPAGVDDMAAPTQATVLLPAEGEFAQISSDLVVPALTEAGLRPVSPSQAVDKPKTVFSLIDSIKRSSVVVVDVTGLDAFILYALGLAHGLEKPTVLLTQEISELPFDLRSYNVVPYSTRLDEIGRLKDDLRKVLLEFAEKDHSLATPVTDILGPRLKSPNVENDQAEAEDEAPGIYDLLPSSIRAMEELGADTVVFGNLTEALGSAVQAQTAEIESAKARGGPGALGRTMLSVRTVTAHVDEYADQVAEIAPKFEAQWSEFFNSAMGWLELVDLESQEDREAAIEYAGHLADLRETMLGSAHHVEGFRGAVVGLRERRLSKDLGRSLSRVEKLLRAWIEQVLTGASQLERMRALLLERLEG